MAIAISNQTASNLNPNATSQTLPFTVFAGSDRTLLVVITMPNAVNFAGATYDGVPMTLVRATNFSGIGQRQAAYILQNPNTGSNNIVLSFTGTQVQSTSIYAAAFTGAGGFDNDAANISSNTPNSRSLTIQAGSIIYATGISTFSQSFNYTIDGSSRTPSFNGHNTGTEIVEGALSAVGLTAGSKEVTTRADAGSITNYRIAILEAGGGPAPTRRRINIA